MWVLVVALVIAGSLGIYFYWSTSSPGRADGQIAFNGADMQLRVPVPDARAGARLRWGERVVPVRDGQAVFANSAAYIQPGVNQISVMLESANGDVDPLTVSFRTPFTITIDRAGLSATPATLALVFGADENVSVQVDGAMQTFDEQRTARFEIEVPPAGSSDEPYTRELRVAATDGTNILDTLRVPVEVPYARLTLVDPLAPVITTSDSIRVAGTATEEAVVQLGDTTLNRQGAAFSHMVAMPTEGDYTATLRASVAGGVSISREVSIRRVTSLRQAAAEFGANQDISYERLRDEPDEHEGERVRFSGTVYSVRPGANHTNVQIVVRGCEDRGECPLWIRAPRGVEIRNGSRVDVYGLAARYQEFRVRGRDGVDRRTSHPRVDAVIILPASR